MRPNFPKFKAVLVMFAADVMDYQCSFARLKIIIIIMASV